MVTEELDCVRAVRAELASSYPRVRPLRILRILRRFGMRRLPSGLLLDASLLSPGPRGALAMLFRAGRPRLARGLRWHPLFSEDFYLGTSPDVARAGANAWLHYQVFGRAEGRSPHPLIDVDYLASAVAPTRRDEVVDLYVSDRRVWDLDPSPYVECTRFLLEGPWDGRTHPLVQIVEHHADGAWIKRRLMVVDVGSMDDARSRLTGAAILVASRGAASTGSPVRLWEPGSDWISSGVATVAPGFFLGVGEREVCSTPGWVLSEDESIVKLAGGHMSIPAGPVARVDDLIVLFGSLDHDRLEGLADAAGTIAIAPSSPHQGSALASLFGETSRVVVLEYGRQARVDARRIIKLDGATSLLELPEWDPSAGEPLETAFLLPRDHHRRVANDAQLISWIERGASLCLLGDEGFDAWHPVLASRSTVVVERSLSEKARNAIGERGLVLLPVGDFGVKQ